MKTLCVSFQAVELVLSVENMDKMLPDLRIKEHLHFRIHCGIISPLTVPLRDGPFSLTACFLRVNDVLSRLVNTEGVVIDA